jgi:hypothetical protein
MLKQKHYCHSTAKSTNCTAKFSAFIQKIKLFNQELFLQYFIISFLMKTNKLIIKEKEGTPSFCPKKT